MRIIPPWKWRENICAVRPIHEIMMLFWYRMVLCSFWGNWIRDAATGDDCCVNYGFIRSNLWKFKNFLNLGFLNDSKTSNFWQDFPVLIVLNPNIPFLILTISNIHCSSVYHVNFQIFFIYSEKESLVGLIFVNFLLWIMIGMWDFVVFVG